MKKIGISENKITKYLFLIAIISVIVFSFRVFIVEDYSLENNTYSIDEKPYCDVSAPTLLIFSSDVPSLYYYSRIGFYLINHCRTFAT